MSDFWTDVEGGLKAVAPVLASAVGTPLAGAAVSAMLNAIWPGDSSKSMADLQAAITQGQITPDQMLALKQADNDFAEKMKALDVQMDDMKVQEDQIDATDRASARVLQTSTRSITAPVLGGCIMAGFFSLLGMLVFYTPPTANQSILNVMFGYLGGMATSVVAFYFGSSHGKQAQDDAMAQIAAQPEVLATVPAGSTPVQGLPWKSQ